MPVLFGKQTINESIKCIAKHAICRRVVKQRKQGTGKAPALT